MKAGITMALLRSHKEMKMNSDLSVRAEHFGNLSTGLSKHDRRDECRKLLTASAVHPSTMLRACPVPDTGANGKIAYFHGNDGP